MQPRFPPSVMSCMPAGMHFQPFPPSAEQASQYYAQQQQSHPAGARPPPPAPLFMMPGPPMMLVPAPVGWGPMAMPQAGGPAFKGQRPPPGPGQGGQSGRRPPPGHVAHPPPPPRRTHLPSAPPPRRPKRAREVAPSVEKLTVDPVVRAPQSAAEAEEVARWVAERRRHFPTAANLARKEEERREQGAADERRRRLQEVLATQERMGLTKQAGTAELAARLARSRGAGGGAGRAQDGRPRAAGAKVPGDRVAEAPSLAGVLPLLDAYASDDESGAGAVEAQAEGTPGGESAPAVDGASTALDTNPQEGTAARYARERAQYLQQQKEYAAGGKRGVQFAKQPSDRKRAGVRSTGPDPGRPAGPRRASLLQKLLSKDLRQDQEYLLQAIRFLVQNSFLEGDTTPDKLWFPEEASNSSQAEEDASDDGDDACCLEESAAGDV
ncbi:hypothetical protein QBZ16_001222 [Prototheca wickerhamii]|uniref:FMR1-interacting protein 1 conserved domain-containing protein n=1 Tax=Prototheca wickerhamii TaxID=3111 RepID=A0AAD9MJB6_PROWI|nr:hypothetical protein QBZ16_001222 [Prototheca wickerhamii]